MTIVEVPPTCIAILMPLNFQQLTALTTKAKLDKQMKYVINTVMIENGAADTDSPRRQPERVLDDISYGAAEVDKLEQTIPIQTMVGAMLLHDLVVDGAGSKLQITRRQEAVDELGSNLTLAETLAAGLAEFAARESRTLEFLDNDNGSAWYKSTVKAMGGLNELDKAMKGKGMEAPETSFLRENVRALQDFNGTKLAKKLRGPLYYTPLGVRGREELHWFSPRLRFRPGFSGRVALANAGTLYAGRHGVMPPEIAMVPGVAMYVSLITTLERSDHRRLKDEVWSFPTVYRGLRKCLRATPEYQEMLGAIGKLDTAVALNGWRQQIEANGHRTAFPAVEESELYYFNADGMKNPLLALEAGKLIVANSIKLGGEDRRLTFLSGPNSGGKSTLSKAIIQNQVLGQMGGVMVANQASITIADGIAYHAPMPPALEDETGRFGFELGRVDRLLEAASPRSLTVLDDCLDGTTHEERVAVLKNVMLGFRNLGGATIFSTHAHELISQFEENRIGQLLQVEFQNDNPTYSLIPGVSHTSHAERVAEKFNFTARQVQERIRARGIERPIWF